MLEDSPVVFGPKSNVSDPICVECLSYVESRRLMCRQCRMTLCRKCNVEECRRHHSDRECKMLKEVLEKSGSPDWTGDQLVAVLKSLAPLRLFLAQIDDVTIRKRLDFLMDHLSERSNVRKITILDFFVNFTKLINVH